MLHFLLAQAESARAEPGVLVSLFVSWGPAICLFLALYFLVMKPLKITSRKQQQRYDEYTERMESGTKQMIELLKEIRDRLPPK